MKTFGSAALKILLCRTPTTRNWRSQAKRTRQVFVRYRNYRENYIELHRRNVITRTNEHRRLMSTKKTQKKKLTKRSTEGSQDTQSGEKSKYINTVTDLCVWQEKTDTLLALPFLISERLVNIQVIFRTPCRTLDPGFESHQCLYFYRPQTKFAKVMFLHLSVSHSVHGGVPGRYPPGRYAPLGRYTPRQVHPLVRYTPLATVHAGIRSTSGQYASHWNAFLLCTRMWI